MLKLFFNKLALKVFFIKGSSDSMAFEKYDSDNNYFKHQKNFAYHLLIISANASNSSRNILSFTIYLHIYTGTLTHLHRHSSGS